MKLTGGAKVMIFLVIVFMAWLLSALIGYFGWFLGIILFLFLLK
jgi:hypothetical protein